MTITAELLGTLGGKGHYSYRVEPQETSAIGIYEPVQMTFVKGASVVPPGTYWMVLTASRVSTITISVRCLGKTASITVQGSVILFSEEVTFTSPWTPLVEFSGTASTIGNRRIREVALTLVPI